MRIIPDYLPIQLGALLFTLAMIALLAPYFAGIDLGIFKIPNLPDSVRRRLKWIGPLALALALLIHVPIGTPKKRYKTCRLPDFGIERWRGEDVIREWSGWQGGGSTAETWCSELKNRILRSRSLEPQYEMKVLKTDTKARWTGIRHREYNYECKIKINWDPIYNERTDPRCGVAE